MIVFLIGFRATGKTTLGKLLAERLDCPWLDSDVEIEETAGKTIAEIFENEGESTFRQIERQVICNLARTADANSVTVISLGGGALMDQATRGLVGDHVAIWLHAPAELLAKRMEDTRQQTPRPALTELSLSDEVNALLQQRQPVYSDCADYDIDTSQWSIDASVERIANWLEDVDKT